MSYTWRSAQKKEEDWIDVCGFNAKYVCIYIYELSAEYLFQAAYSVKPRLGRGQMAVPVLVLWEKVSLDRQGLGDIVPFGNTVRLVTKEVAICADLLTTRDERDRFTKPHVIRNRGSIGVILFAMVAYYSDVSSSTCTSTFIFLWFVKFNSPYVRYASVEVEGSLVTSAMLQAAT
ncbi:hypothetical protein BDY19DRAFT_1032931 [Irpex rosettiformis]|uniref:Uncharacterized protein n=1 Tax=Irpex rosettiformis TaxID=378272 RepID=A0ACB8UA20_9APHY|nr:hypothetical protein BDY19DRAFT_1032931 [Irpex rosettiformis]